MSDQSILLATRNQGKLDEFRDLLADLSVHVISLADYNTDFDVIEDGTTFSENAIKKAKAAAVHFQCITVADDSGLEVDALNGEPGVHSARFAGRQGDDRANNQKLLQLLAKIPFENRTARFQCVIAVALPTGRVFTAEGTCEGIIGFELRGENGFGYDPLFWVPEEQRTFAELEMEIKNRISHRARAFREAREILKDLLVETD